MESRVIDVKPEDSAEEKPKYSTFNDSQFATYLGKSAGVVNYLDLIINNVIPRIEKMSGATMRLAPYWVKTLYYIVPLAIPLIPYVRHRWSNVVEEHDPDALRLIEILKSNDELFAAQLQQNPQEEKQILADLTNFMRQVKSQKFNMIGNLILLGFRAIEGVLLFVSAAGVFSPEAHEKLSEWDALLLTIANVTFGFVTSIYKNFLSTLPDDIHEHVKSSGLLQQTFLRFKEKRKVKIGDAEFAVGLLDDDKRQATKKV